MIVYVVRKIDDYEYGCRNIEGIFSTPEAAESYIESTGNQGEFDFWNGSKEMLYIVEEREVQTSSTNNNEVQSAVREFPVDVGDKVWYIYGGYYCKTLLEPREITVTEINKKKSGKTVDWAFIANGTRYRFSSIGKSVFLSKEACEAEINRRKGRKK